MADMNIVEIYEALKNALTEEDNQEIENKEELVPEEPETINPSSQLEPEQEEKPVEKTESEPVQPVQNVSVKKLRPGPGVKEKDDFYDDYFDFSNKVFYGRSTTDVVNELKTAIDGKNGLTVYANQKLTLRPNRKTIKVWSYFKKKDEPVSFNGNKVDNLAQRASKEDLEAQNKEDNKEKFMAIPRDRHTVSLIVEATIEVYHKPVEIYKGNESIDLDERKIADIKCYGYYDFHDNGGVNQESLIGYYQEGKESSFENAIDSLFFNMSNNGKSISKEKVLENNHIFAMNVSYNFKDNSNKKYDNPNGFTFVSEGKELESIIDAIWLETKRSNNVVIIKDKDPNTKSYKYEYAQLISNRSDTDYLIIKYDGYQWNISKSNVETWSYGNNKRINVYILDRLSIKEVNGHRNIDNVPIDIRSKYKDSAFSNDEQEQLNKEVNDEQEKEKKYIIDENLDNAISNYIEYYNNRSDRKSSKILKNDLIETFWNYNTNDILQKVEKYDDMLNNKYKSDNDNKSFLISQECLDLIKDTVSKRPEKYDFYLKRIPEIVPKIENKDEIFSINSNASDELNELFADYMNGKYYITNSPFHGGRSGSKINNKFKLLMENLWNENINNETKTVNNDKNTSIEELVDIITDDSKAFEDKERENKKLEKSKIADKEFKEKKFDELAEKAANVEKELEKFDDIESLEDAKYDIETWKNDLSEDVSDYTKLNEQYKLSDEDYYDIYRLYKEYQNASDKDKFFEEQYNKYQANKNKGRNVYFINLDNVLKDIKVSDGKNAMKNTFRKEANESGNIIFYADNLDAPKEIYDVTKKYDKDGLFNNLKNTDYYEYVKLMNDNNDFHKLFDDLDIDTILNKANNSNEVVKKYIAKSLFEIVESKLFAEHGRITKSNLNKVIDILNRFDGFSDKQMKYIGDKIYECIDDGSIDLVYNKELLGKLEKDFDRLFDEKQSKDIGEDLVVEMKKLSKSFGEDILKASYISKIDLAHASREYNDINDFILNAINNDMIVDNLNDKQKNYIVSYFATITERYQLYKELYNYMISKGIERISDEDISRTDIKKKSYNNELKYEYNKKQEFDPVKQLKDKLYIED